MALTTVDTTALSGTITNAQLAGSIDLTSKVTGTLPAANGGTGATSYAPGKILQVVTDTITSDNYTTSTSSSNLLTVSITPSATTSKILVLCTVQYNIYGNGSSSYPSGNCRMIYDVTGAATLLAQGMGLASGNVSTDQTDQWNSTLHLFHLHSPSSTSSIGYTLAYEANGGRWGVLGSAGSTDNGTTVTLMELGA